jgi:hypothetical protein
MAIENLSSGKYLKLIREETVFKGSSVEVCFYEFDSREDRDKYFKRKSEVSEFVERVTAIVDGWLADVNTKIEAWAAENKVTNLSIDMLPKEFSDTIKKCSRMSEDLSILRFGWDKIEPLPTLSSQKDFDKLGFSKDWLTPLNQWSICTAYTGAFTNQNFSAECLYKELKKVFKDYVDC